MDSTINAHDIVEFDAPRNSYFALHILFNNLNIDEDLTFDSSIAGDWYQLLAVPVEENTGVNSRTEQFDGLNNIHIIREAPFEIYEVLKPIQNLIQPNKKTVALRFEIPISGKMKPETKKIVLNFTQNNKKYSKKISLNIHKAIVPPSGKSTLCYTNWFNINKIATYHNLQKNSTEHLAMVDKYVDLMRRGRQNTFWVSWTHFFSDDLLLDKNKLKNYINRLTKAGMWWIECAPLAHRPNGDWGSPYLQLRMGEGMLHTEDGQRDLKLVTTQLMESIEEFGWTDRWLQHIADEPTDTNAAQYNHVASLLDTHMPHIPIVEATMSRKLKNAVDVWCPQVQKFEENIDFFMDQQKEGKDIWTYTCLIPGGKWLNRLLDMERLRQVYFGWAASKYQLSGYLHWGLNQYYGNPFEQSVVDHPAMPNTTNKLPAGDTHVIYPGLDGPWSGLRFEAHRIGFEDYELLQQLKQQNTAEYTNLMLEIFRKYNDYETDVKKYRSIRKQLITSLNKISAKDSF